MEAGLWAPTSPAVGGSALCANRRPCCRATFPGISPVVCDMTQWRNWVMSRQRETPRGAPRTVPSSSGKRNTVLIATLTERPFFSFVEATSRFLGSYEKALASFSSFWNVIRLPVTRSVGLKGQGGPGVSETRGGACDVIVRRHEASPRVTERPSATLRLRHPVPALPPFGSTDAGYSSDANDCASSCRESDERFVSAVQTANRRCVHKRRSPHECGVAARSVTVVSWISRPFGPYRSLLR